MVYSAINNFLVNHIPEITFAFVTIVYVFFWKYVIIFLEKIFRGAATAAFENRTILQKILRIADSFIIFLLTIFFLIPIIKSFLEKYIEPRLDTPYLSLIVLGGVVLTYLYYMFVYSKQIHHD